MRKSSIQIAMASLVVWLPNIIWNIWLPLLFLTMVSLIDFKLRSQVKLLTLSFLYLFVLFIVKDNYFFLPYTVFFLACLFVMSELPIYEKRDLNAFITCSAMLLFLSYLYVLLQFDFVTLNSRQNFDDSNFLRVRLFFSEPAHLGVWCGFLFALSVIEKRSKVACLFAIGVIVSSSLGAFLFTASLIFSRQFVEVGRDRKFEVLVIIAFFAILLFVNLLQFQSKLSQESLSIVNRTVNIDIVWSYFLTNFGSINGFGPILYDDMPVGILNFNLLLLISMGFFVFFFVPFQLIPFHIFVPYLVLSVFIGNFWESPLLILLFNRHYLKNSILKGGGKKIKTHHLNFKEDSNVHKNVS
ncbi:hypothetical protein OAA71_02180 [Porticoccaceae bacterium]|nr:hypothetical protein [Porticoccaceae bacterium]